MNCGPFDLVEPIATGGMGQVWRARHGATTVAIKIVRLPSEEAAALFEEEVRAHARLQHPHILQVLDFGRTEHAFQNTPAGTPWLALEHVSGGDLRKRELRWDATRVILLAVLDALAHAHAHGVVHRDLKLGNILVGTPADLRPGIKLADFGIAHLQDARPTASRSDEEPMVEGTPISMAPEQATGRTRLFGPWTDLYGLGCVTHKLVGGRWPFRGAPHQILAKQAYARAPKLRARFPVPSGLQEWVDRMLAKHPAARFRSAREAAEALCALDPNGHSDALPNVLLTTAAVVDGAMTSPDWRRPASPPPPRPLADAGQGLFALRPWPTFGREAERDLLWRELQAARASGTPRTVVLTAPPGTGKSHLARWITQVARARGLAEGFTVRCTADDGPGTALLRMLRALLRAEGLAGEALVEGIRNNLDLWGVEDEALCTILAELCEGRLETQRYRRGALRRVVVDRAGRAGGGVFVVDDAMHGPDAVHFVRSTIGNAVQTPLLFVLAADELTEPLAQLIEQPGVVHLELPPMDRVSLMQLLEHVLPMAPALKSRLISSANGRPGRAASQLAFLLEEDRIQSGDGGFELVGDSLSNIPGASAVARLERVIEPDPSCGRFLLQAAVFGIEVDDTLWSAACDEGAAEWEIPLGALRSRALLVDRLVRSGHAAPTRSGWRFRDSAFRDAVLIRFGENELADAHRRAAQVLAERDDTHPMTVADHLSAAGQLEESLAAHIGFLLGTTVQRERWAGDLHLACANALELLDRLGVPADDEVRGQVRARALHLAHATDGQSRSAAGRLLADARTHAWLDVELGCLGLMASIDANTHPIRAADRIDRAVALLPRVPHPSRIALSGLRRLGWALDRLERREQAIHLLDRVVELAREQGFIGIAWSCRARSLGSQAMQGVELDIDALLEERDACIADGFRSTAASIEVVAADCAAERGDLDRADALNTLAHERLRTFGYTAQAPMLNLAASGVLRGDPDQVRHWLDEASRTRIHQPVWALPVAILELCWAALRGDTNLCRARCDGIEEVLQRSTREVYPEESRLLQRAADLLATEDPTMAARIRSWA